MPTTEIGVFPDYLTTVISLLVAANNGSEVDIVIDSPDHGSMSSYALHRETHLAIKAAKARGAKVRILMPEKFARISRANPDFKYGERARTFGEHFQVLRQTPGFTEFFQGQLPSLLRAVEPVTPKEFDRCTDIHMHVVLADLVKCKIAVGLLSMVLWDEVNVFMWRVDDNAIYVPLSQAHNNPAIGYRARGLPDTQPFVSVFTQRWSAARKIKASDLKALFTTFASGGDQDEN